MNNDNQQFDAKFLNSAGLTFTRTIVLHRKRDTDFVYESEWAYQGRFANIVSFKNGVLSLISDIEEVQFVLNHCGYKVSNCILIDVGILRDID